MKRLSLICTLCLLLCILFAACRKNTSAIPGITHATGADSVYFQANGYLYTTNNIWFTAVNAYNKQCLWDFGDGKTAVGKDAIGHEYALPGAYTAKLTVDNKTTTLVINITDDWKRLIAMRNWQKRLYSVVNATPVNVYNADTTFAIEAIDFNRLILIKDSRSNFQDTLSMRIDNNTYYPTTISNRIVYTCNRTDYQAQLIWYPSIDSVYIFRKNTQASKENMLEYYSKK